MVRPRRRKAYETRSYVLCVRLWTVAVGFTLALVFVTIPAVSVTTGQAGTSSAPADAYDFSGPYSRPLTQGDLAIRPADHVYIASPFDGADIEMGIWRPVTETPVPILVHASPYYGYLMTQTTVMDDAAWYGNLIHSLVPHGYAVVGLAVRGTGDSGGCNDVFGPAETADINAAIDWLAKQAWSTGRIAFTGLSYDGGAAWSAAATGNPHVKTIIPVSGVPDLYGLMYRNGSSENRATFLNAAYYGLSIPTTGQQADRPAIRTVCPDALQGIAWSEYSTVTGAMDPSGFWSQRNRKPLVEANYEGSIWSVQGLKDYNVDPSQVIPWVDQLNASGTKTKQMLGLWYHRYPDMPDSAEGGWTRRRADFAQNLLLWLDSELKGKQVDTGPAVEVQDDLGRWRAEAHYPPHDTQWTTYHLDGHTLRTEPGPRTSVVLYPMVNARGSAVPPSPPLGVELGVEGALDLALEPAAEDLLIVGLPKVHVTATPHGPGGYLGAWLYDARPDGTMRGIGWTTMNLAFADGGTTPRSVVPGEPLEVKMEIQPMDAVVKAGHHLVLRIWMFTDQDRLPTLPAAPVTLEMGGDVNSVLMLPTLVRDPEAYFDPPLPASTDAPSTSSSG